MTAAYAVGHITVKDVAAWDEYRSRVPATLAPWGAELVFRGALQTVLAGQCPHSDIVVIRFPSQQALDGWHASPAYQALLPVRQRAAEVTLLGYSDQL